MTWVGSDGHFAILAVLLALGTAELLLRWLRRPHNHHVPHRKLRAASAWRGPAAGSNAPSNAPAAGAQTLPAADSSDSESAAGHNVLATPPHPSVAWTEPATGVLGRSPVAGPKQPVDVADPRHGVDWCTNPGDPGGADAVVPEPTASARSAA